MTTPTPLDKANDLIAYLLTALDNINRNDSIHYAHGAAEHAIEHARKLMTTRNKDGYREIR